MNTATQETMMDYTPTREEEIARLKAQAADRNAQMDAILTDPIFVEAQENAKTLEKKIKELSKHRDQLEKIAKQLSVLNLITVEEPNEDGYYIFTKKETGYRGGSLRVSKCLLLKGLGEWFNLSEDGNTLPSWNGKRIPFADFLDIDSDCIEATIERFNGELWPFDLLKENGNDESIADAYLQSGDEEGDE